MGPGVVGVLAGLAAFGVIEILRAVWRWHKARPITERPHFFDGRRLLILGGAVTAYVLLFVQVTAQKVLLGGVAVAFVATAEYIGFRTDRNRWKASQVKQLPAPVAHPPAAEPKAEPELAVSTSPKRRPAHVGYQDRPTEGMSNWEARHKVREEEDGPHVDLWIRSTDATTLEVGWVRCLVQGEDGVIYRWPVGTPIPSSDGYRPRSGRHDTTYPNDFHRDDDYQVAAPLPVRGEPYFVKWEDTRTLIRTYEFTVPHRGATNASDASPVDGSPKRAADLRLATRCERTSREIYRFLETLATADVIVGSPGERRVLASYRTKFEARVASVALELSRNGVVDAMGLLDVYAAAHIRIVAMKLGTTAQTIRDSHRG